MSTIQDRLHALPREAFAGLRRGVEKESLRVQGDGALALTPHSRLLGAALTHPHVTTDFSESQLELITSPHATPEACLAELTEIHQVVYRAIGEELLWVASMPCGLPGDDAIPIGQYGSSNIGRMKTVYRIGLAHRYGRRMQMISGIHYNFSVPGQTSESYFALIRNFRRHSWLPLYLFGASPAVCPSFVEGRAHKLLPFAPGTLHLPHATSLRMGQLGYQSDAQASLAVSYNSLDSYAASLHEALTVPYPPYERIGVRQGDYVTGDVVNSYRQLATSLLQIENEFYSPIRAKRTIRQGERPLHALRERGVEYVEVRLMDLDPFEPVGIGARTMRFLDVFLLHCLLSDSPPDTPAELEALARNKLRGAERGREPGLRLERGSKETTLAEWGAEILEGCAPVAAALDAALGGSAHREALVHARSLLEDPARTPSARVLEEIKARHGGSYTRFVIAHSVAHAKTLRALPLAFPAEARHARMTGDSLREQREIEAADTLDFETYRRKYLSPGQLSV